MDSFQWDENFVTGIDEVDRQHMELVRIINRIGDELSNPAASPAGSLAGLIDELTRYAQFHFAAEEAMMASEGIDSSHLQSQSREHAQFIDEINRLSCLTMTPDVSSQLLSFLIHWLAYHILGSDQSMARQLRLIGQGLSPKEALTEDARLGTRATEPLLAALSGLFAQVSQQNRELHELNQSLEAKVAERTRELAIANANLTALSLTDVLTGLPNRRHAMHRIGLEWQASEAPLSLMMIDADGFKTVNDRWGHDAGDSVLRTLAQTLSGAVRTDDMVCRLGGDEFLVICPHTPLKGAMQLGESMRAKVNALRVPAGGGEWLGSVSIGVASRTPKMLAPDDLMRRADEGVYMAKARGRNCVASADLPTGPT